MWTILKNEMTISFQIVSAFHVYWLWWVFVAARGLPPVAASGGFSLLQCPRFLIVVALLVVHDLVIAAYRFRNCSLQALESGLKLLHRLGCHAARGVVLEQ